MNRGCVFASRDLARCGTLQKCGQAAAAAAAAETASQESSPASPTSPWCGGTPGESLQSSSGRGEDAGSPRGRAGRRRGLAPSQVLSLLLHLPVGLPAADGGGARQGWGRRPWRALGFRSRRRRLESGEALLAFTSLAASCPRRHHCLFPAAAPNDSSHFCLCGAVAVPRTRRRNLLQQILHETA